MQTQEPGDSGLEVSQPPTPLAYMREKMADAEALFTAHLTAVSAESGVVDLARDLLVLCEEVAAELLRLAPVKQLDCRAGCDTCCRNLIQVRPIFAFLAMSEARRTFPPEQFEILADRLLNGSPFCPFLFDGRCAVYQARPMVCRGYYSLDRRKCEQGDYCEKDLGYQGEDAHAAHQLMVFLFALEKRIESLEAAAGLEQGAVFLDTAARIILKDPGAATRWLAGERVFSEHAAI